MHDGAYQYIAQRLGRWPPRRAVVEIGGRNINGSVRPLFSAAERYVCVDIVGGEGVDVVADGRSYRPDFKPDTVVCCEVLEHVDDQTAVALIANARRMLWKGGLLLLTCAAPDRDPHSALDGGQLRAGEFYRNVLPETLADWLRSFTVHLLEYHPERGDLYAEAG